MKGGRSQPKRGLAAPQVKTSTTRVPASSEHIMSSLGAGTAANRTPMAKIGAPKPLIGMPAVETELASPAGASVPGALLSAARWLLRRQIAAARDALIELRVHASSPAVHTPAGQELRLDLLDKLWLSIHNHPREGEDHPPDAELEAEFGSGGGGVAAGLFGCAKGHKLLAEVMPLFPEHMVAAILRAAVREVGVIAQLQVRPHLGTCLGPRSSLGG
jgi:hypothetical protein